MAPKSIFSSEDGTKSYLFPFLLVSSLFFLWAVCNGMIDVMDKHFQEELHLSISQSAWVQFSHYLGYFLMALPAGWLARRLGYKGGIIAGLALVAVGGFWFIGATRINAAAQLGHVSMTTAFVGYLAGVCVIASGLTFLETVANPYTTVLGPKEFGAARINFAQSANGVGWLFGPPIGALFFYTKDAAGNNTGSETLYIPYVTVAILATLLIVIFKFAHLPDVKNEDESKPAPLEGDTPPSLMSQKHFIWAVAAQFFYVAAQAGIFSFFINYMTAEVPSFSHNSFTAAFSSFFEAGKDGLLHITDRGAANLATLAFGCFLLGRITGSFILKYNPAHKVLGLYAVLNSIVALLVILKLGWLSVVCVFLSYFFMSIMFPTIFALGIFGLGAKTKKASAFIVMAIMGGAIVPKLMGYVADQYNVSRSFIVPLFCFVFVAIYGLNWSRLSKSEGITGLSPSKGH